MTPDFDFQNLPVLHPHVHTAAVYDKSGCAIIIPCLSEKDVDEQGAKLKAFLDAQPEPPKLVA